MLAAIFTAIVIIGIYLEPWLRLTDSDQTLVASRLQVISVGFSFNYVLSAVSAFGPVVMVLFGVGVLGNEMRWHTIAGQVAQLSAPRLVYRKLLLGACAALGMTLFAVVLGLLCSFAATGTAHGRLLGPQPAMPTGTPASFSEVPGQLGVTLLGLAFWFGLAVALCLVLGGPLAATLTALTYAYVETYVGPHVAPRIADLLPASAQISTLQVFHYLPGADVNPPVMVPSGGIAGACSTVLGYLLVVTAATLWVSRRREYR
jgi:hypothetical protein